MAADPDRADDLGLQGAPHPLPARDGRVHAARRGGWRHHQGRREQQPPGAGAVQRHGAPDQDQNPNAPRVSKHHRRRCNIR